MQWPCYIVSECYVHRKDKYLDIFAADLTDYSAELTGAKGLSTKDNMLDLFEILRGHYSPAGKNKRIPLFLLLLFIFLLTGQIHIIFHRWITHNSLKYICVNSLKLLASIWKLCTTERVRCDCLQNSHITLYYCIKLFMHPWCSSTQWWKL